MQLPKNNDEFIETFPLFKNYRKYSLEFRRAQNNICIGLGLPCLKGRKQSHWGYKIHPDHFHIRIPAGNDIMYLAKANIMREAGDWHIEDIMAWLNSCPLETGKLPLSTYYYICKERPVFPEVLKPWEDRIKLLYDGFSGKFTSFAATAEKEKIRALDGGAEEESEGTEGTEGSGVPEEG
jgi:hypothetical protein